MSVPASLPINLINGTPADATQVMANFNSLLASFGNAAAAGANSDITSLSGITTPLAPSGGGTPVFVGGTSTGSGNVQTVSPTTPPFQLVTGYTVIFTAGFTNSAATTLTVGGQPTKNVFRASPSGPQALTGGEIVAGNITAVTYDGTQFQLINLQSAFGGFGPVTALTPVAGLADLGLVPSHNVSVQAGNITSFGSSASTTFPIYRLVFSGVSVLTNSASLALPYGINLTTANGDAAVALYLGSGNWQVVQLSRFSSLASTRQQFTTPGAGTYTTPANVRQLAIRMVGGGGGGGASSSGNAGTAGTTTTWVLPGPININANGGAGGGSGSASAAGAVGGLGGSAGTGAATLRIGGSDGASTAGSTSGSGASVAYAGGHGGNSFFGGAGRGGSSSITTGNPAAANSGSGGGGGAFANSGLGNSATSGAGGGAGEYVELIINNPAVSYPFTVGAAGTGGSAGGGNGAAGIIIVEERY